MSKFENPPQFNPEEISSTSEKVELADKERQIVKSLESLPFVKMHSLGNRVDLLLVYAGMKPAADITIGKLGCEISMTSTSVQELANIEKCFAADVERVVIVSPHRRVLQAVEQKARQKLDKQALERVMFSTPAEFLPILDAFPETSIRQDREATVLGYKVKTTLRAQTTQEQGGRTQAVAQTILKALKRLGQRS